MPPHVPSTTHEVGTQLPSETPPPPAVSRLHQHPPPNIDPRLGLLPLHSLSTTSREVGARLPSGTLPASSVSQHSPSIDPRLDSLPPHTAVSHEVGVQPPGTLSLTCSLTVPPPETNPNPEESDSDTEELDTDVAQAHDLDIDERSDDEDDRMAHELLRAPVMSQVTSSNPPVLSYGHQGFSVS